MSETNTSQRDRKVRPGRPSKPLAQRRTERVSFGVTKAQKAAFLVNATRSGLTSNDYARRLLCDDPGNGAARPNSFELIDVLSRIGADLARLRFIAEQTDTVPTGLDDAIVRLDQKLDVLIVGSGIADELSAHRAKLIEIADKLDQRSEMTAKARGMITTFDRVVNKILSS
jgi:Mobilization protein NikA